VLVVTKTDRLARSVAHLLTLVEQLAARGVGLRILNMGLGSSTATGRMMLTVVGAIAQFEREMMLERQREGIAKAKADGKYKGRKPTARAKAATRPTRRPSDGRCDIDPQTTAPHRFQRVGSAGARFEFPPVQVQCPVR
jgi:DNA invertase Pin-like site-specific DNA recombinase